MHTIPVRRRAYKWLWRRQTQLASCKTLAHLLKSAWKLERSRIYNETTSRMGRRDPLAANRAAPASRAAPKAEAAKSPASSRAGSPRGPPTVDAAKLQIPDCSGQLKKTSKSRLSGRAWKKRWLRVRLDLKDGENYALTYHKKEHDDARMTLALAGCAVRELEGADGWRDFRVFDAHEAFELRATSTEERRAWIDSLRHVITVADARARWIEANASCASKTRKSRHPSAPSNSRTAQPASASVIRASSCSFLWYVSA